MLAKRTNRRRLMNDSRLAGGDQRPVARSFLSLAIAASSTSFLESHPGILVSRGGGSQTLHRTVTKPICRCRGRRTIGLRIRTTCAALRRRRPHAASIDHTRPSFVDAFRRNSYPRAALNDCCCCCRCVILTSLSVGRCVYKLYS